MVFKSNVVSFVLSSCLLADSGYVVLWREYISGVRHHIKQVQSLNANAYGVNASANLTLQAALGLRRGVIRIDDVDGYQNAYGFYDKKSRKKLAYNLNGGKISIGNIVAQTQNAYGIYNASNVTFTLEKNFFSKDNGEFLISHITSKQKDAYGIYQASGNGIFNLKSSKISIDSINAQGISYGVYANTGSSLDFSLEDSSLYLGAKGEKAQAFGGSGSVTITLDNSSLTIGGGGKIQTLTLKNSLSSNNRTNTISLLGNSSSEGVLEIESLGFNPMSHLNLALGADAKKGTSNQIKIGNFKSSSSTLPVNLSLKLNSGWKPKEWKSQNKELVLLSVANANQKISLRNSFTSDTQGFLDIQTTLHTRISSNTQEIYLDLREKPQYSITSSVKDIAYLSAKGIYSAYFGQIDSLNHRLGDLINNPTKSGVWGRIGVGGESFDDYTMHHFDINLGGDYVAHFFRFFTSFGSKFFFFEVFER